MCGRAGRGDGRCRGSHGAPSIPWPWLCVLGRRNGSAAGSRTRCCPGVARVRTGRSGASRSGINGWCRALVPGACHGVVCGHLQRLHHALQPVAQALGAQPLARSTISGGAKGVGRSSGITDGCWPFMPLQGLGQGNPVPAPTSARAWARQRVVRVVLRKHVVVEDERCKTAALLAGWL